MFLLALGLFFLTFFSFSALLKGNVFFFLGFLSKSKLFLKLRRCRCYLPKPPTSRVDGTLQAQRHPKHVEPTPINMHFRNAITRVSLSPDCQGAPENLLKAYTLKGPWETPQDLASGGSNPWGHRLLSPIGVCFRFPPV